MGIQYYMMGIQSVIHNVLAKQCLAHALTSYHQHLISLLPCESNKPDYMKHF